jgi:hypothetical protein
MAEAKIAPLRPDQASYYQIIQTVADMSPIAADTLCKRAEADKAIADSTHAAPARQETARTGIVTGAILVLTIIGALICSPDKAATIFTTGLVVLGGAWGVPEAVKYLRKPPAT